MTKDNKEQIKGTHKSDQVTQALQTVLRTTYNTFLATHNYHWNIEGSKFVSLHKLFEEHYTELFAAIDEIAERIRGLEAYSLPFEDKKIVALFNNMRNPLVEHESAEDRARMMVENLIELNTEVIKACQAGKQASTEEGDDETEDMLIARIQVHQENNWMYRSIIKQ